MYGFDFSRYMLHARGVGARSDLGFAGAVCRGLGSAAQFKRGGFQLFSASGLGCSFELHGRSTTVKMTSTTASFPASQQNILHSSGPSTNYCRFSRWRGARGWRGECRFVKSSYLFVYLCRCWSRRVVRGLVLSC